ncbi:hypothetical protein M2273_002245 [Mucilaginibacter lappiensis]
MKTGDINVVSGYSSCSLLFFQPILNFLKVFSAVAAKSFKSCKKEFENCVLKAKNRV